MDHADEPKHSKDWQQIDEDTVVVDIEHDQEVVRLISVQTLIHLLEWWSILEGHKGKVQCEKADACKHIGDVLGNKQLGQRKQNKVLIS